MYTHTHTHTTEEYTTYLHTHKTLGPDSVVVTPINN